MKKLLLIIILLPLISFSQSQMVNGISLNAPKDFVKAGDLHWSNGNENVIIQYFKGNFVNTSSEKSTCEEGSRSSDFIDFGQIEHDGKTIDICFQKGHNGLTIGGTMIYRDGYTYNIMVSANPDDYQRAAYIIGYMVTRVTSY